MSNPEAILTASNVSKSFQMGDSTVQVLKDVDLQVQTGEFVAIEGRSGSGKSTLLHILGSLESVSDGHTHFAGTDYTLHEPAPAPRSVELFSRWQVLVCLVIALLLTMAAVVIVGNELIPDLPTEGDLTLSAAASDEAITSTTIHRLAQLFIGLQVLWYTLIAAWLALFVYRFWRRREYRQRQNSAAAIRRRDFGFIFQFYHLLPELNVLENVLFPSMVDHGWLGYLRQRSQLRRRAGDLLRELGMEHRLKHKPAQLSGGERQRVAIARALMNSPKILFADEPTGNLDIETGKQIMHVLEDLHRKKGQTIVMVTHDRAVARQADRVLVMASGKLHAAG